MVRSITLALILLALPVSAFASTLQSSRTLVLSEPADGNAYLAGTDVTVAAPQPGDLLAAGATISVQAPITGDVMLAGGTIDINKPITGDVRIVGGQITLDGAVGGDLILAGGAITASTSAKDTRIAGGTVKLSGGSSGPVVIYGSDITISGDFKGDVTLVASDRITIEDGTHIHGSLHYNAPQQITTPTGVVIDGGTTYIGSSSFLPTSQEAHTFAVAGATILFIVHLLAVLVLAGLLAGLFPVFTERVAEKALTRTPGTFVLYALLGFGVMVAAPFLIFFLMVTFVGIGIALILLSLYALLFILAYTYAGILAGAALARALMKRYVIGWKEAVLGMLVLYLVGIIPVLGMLVKFVLMMAAGGTIVSIAYLFAFKKNQDELPLE
jgi:cytoskeletal protein CcmA (bactofilin family)